MGTHICVYMWCLYICLHVFVGVGTPCVEARGCCQLSLFTKVRSLAELRAHWYPLKFPLSISQAVTFQVGYHHTSLAFIKILFLMLAREVHYPLNHLLSPNSLLSWLTQEIPQAETILDDCVQMTMCLHWVLTTQPLIHTVGEEEKWEDSAFVVSTSSQRSKAHI